MQWVAFVVLFMVLVQTWLLWSIDSRLDRIRSKLDDLSFKVDDTQALLGLIRDGVHKVEIVPRGSGID